MFNAIIEGPKWKQAFVPYESDEVYQLVLEGVRGNGTEGDIVIFNSESFRYCKMSGYTDSILFQSKKGA